MTILKIDRTAPFNPAAFIGEGWSIVEQDERSLTLTEVDLTKISFKTMTLEDVWGSEEMLSRIVVADAIRLDAKVFQALWENQHLIPSAWKESTNGYLTWHRFAGTILRNSDGSNFVLALFWYDDEWYWQYSCFNVEWFPETTSAVLTS